MPTKPITVTKNLTSSDMQNVIGAIRKNASPFYRNQVGAVLNERDLPRFYAELTAYDSITQEFMSMLWGRIAKTIISSKIWRNPLGFLKKGMIELGEVIEDAFVNPAKVHIYDEVDVPDAETLKREPSDIRTAFYVLNYQTFYKTTIFNNQLEKYFLSWDGVENLIAKMTEALYNGEYEDEYNVMKYIVIQQMLNGQIYTVDVGDFTTDAKSAVKAIKKVSNDMIFRKTKYNRAGVSTFTPKEDQFFLITSDFDATESVDVLSSAFNMDKVEFEGHKILVDTFTELKLETINKLFKNDESFTPLTMQDLEQFKNVAGIIIDRDWYQIYDKLIKFTEQYNAQKMFWNYFLQIWKIVASSPFANAVALVNGKPTVTGVTVAPTAVSINPGQGVALQAEVATTGFATSQVTWTSSTTNITVNDKGYVKVSSLAKTGDTANIIATSVADPTKSATCVVTVL